MSETEVRDWLVACVARYINRPPSEVDPEVKLRSYGLDSVYALTLCLDIEEEFGMQFDPTLAWDYPTIAAIAGHMVERMP